VLDYLRSAAPLIRNRPTESSALYGKAAPGYPGASPIRSFRLRDEIGRLCRLYRLDCSQRSQSGQRAGEYLDSALDTS